VSHKRIFCAVHRDLPVAVVVLAALCKQAIWAVFYAGIILFSCGKGIESLHLGTGLFVHKRTVSVIKRAEFYFSDMKSCVMLKVAGVILMNMLPQSSIKVMAERLGSMKNYSKYSVSSLRTYVNSFKMF
jgi:hypothetical protein